ncbi:MAG: hypothetical protein ACLR3C_08190 [Eggerthella lenta]
MRNVLLSGVGGQGTVLAAKVLACGRADKGWQVRTAETIAAARRTCRVRMGDAGEEVFARCWPGTADLVIAASRPRRPRAAVPAPDGLLVTATQPSAGTAALSDGPIAPTTLANIERSLAGIGARFVAVDDVALTDAVAAAVLNSVLLASALGVASRLTSTTCAAPSRSADALRRLPGRRRRGGCAIICAPRPTPAPAPRPAPRARLVGKALARSGSPSSLSTAP